MMVLYDDSILWEPCVSCDKCYMEECYTDDDYYWVYLCDEKECVHREEYKKKNTYLTLKEELYLRPINEKYVEDSIYKPVCGDVCLQVILLQKTNEYTATAVITKALINKLQVNEEEVFTDALGNTVDRSKNCFFSLDNVVDLLKGKSSTEDIDPNAVGTILTNEDLTYGAVNLFLPGVAKEIYEKIGVFYVCFTSVHEAAIHTLKHFPNEEMLDGLFETLQEVTTTAGYGHDSNQTLSSYVYIYDPEEDRFEVAKK